MPVSVFSNLRFKLREAIRDVFSIAWTDTELDETINEAQREYSLQAGTLSGVVDVVTTARNIYEAPADFIEPIKFIDAAGIEIPIYSWRYLNECYPDFRKITGDYAKGICFDFDGYGFFRVFPVLPAGTSAGRLYYKRAAANNVIETPNLEAIEQHSLFQMFLFTGKNAAGNYWNNFISAVNRESNSSQTLKNRKRSKLGRFF